MATLFPAQAALLPIATDLPDAFVAPSPIAIDSEFELAPLPIETQSTPSAIVSSPNATAPSALASALLPIAIELVPDASAGVVVNDPFDCNELAPVPDSKPCGVAGKPVTVPVKLTVDVLTCIGSTPPLPSSRFLSVPSIGSSSEVLIKPSYVFLIFLFTKLDICCCVYLFICFFML